MCCNLCVDTCDYHWMFSLHEFRLIVLPYVTHEEQYSSFILGRVIKEREDKENRGMNGRVREVKKGGVGR